MAESSTTEIIRRRIRHTKTTIAGVATIAGPVLVALWPQHAAAITAVVSACTGMGLIAAADASALKKD